MNRRPLEQIKSLQGNFSQQRRLANSNSHREKRRWKGPCVEDDKLAIAIEIPQCRTQTNRAAPVMYQQTDVLKIKLTHKIRQMIDMNL